MEYYINDLSKRVERTDKITFSYSNKNFEEKEDVYINKKFLTFYTSFFEKNYLFCDNVFSLPFEVSIAERCLYHVHTLFIHLEHDDKLFFLLKGFDYFCIDVFGIYKNLITLLHFRDLYRLNDYTKELLNYETPFSIIILNELYDRYFLNENFTLAFTSDKNILLFLLKRKWLIYSKKDVFIKNSSILEYYLLHSILTFVNILGSDEEKERNFKELWSFIIPYFLSKDTLTMITNLSFSRCIRDELIECVHQKYGMFSKKEVLRKTRFRIKNDHVKEFNIGDRLQTLDNQKCWYNSTIIDVNDDIIIIKFDNFNDTYNEIISRKDIHRFLPLSTLEKGYSCPCDLCLN